MKSIRIGNDIRIEWEVSMDSDITQVQNLCLSVEVQPSSQIVNWHNYTDAPTLHKSEHTVMLNGGACVSRGGRGGYPPMSPRERMPFQPARPGCPPPPGDPRNALFPVKLPWYVEDGKIVAIWSADKQFATGEYDILLYAHKGEPGQAVVDQYRFVRLVEHTAQADTDGEGGIAAVITMKPLTLKMSGLSAYEIAVKNGYVGTEEAWLESLRMDTDTARDYSAAIAGATARFDGEVKGVTVTDNDSTTELAVDSVWYDTEKKCFVGLKDGKYYTTWTGSNMYNLGDAARQDKLYVQGDSIYYWNVDAGTLAKVSVASDDDSDDDGVATVSLDALDDYKLDLKDHSKAGVYKVVTETNGVTLSVGTLMVSGDSFGHGTDQVLITNMNDTDGVIDSSTHTDGSLQIYHRYYNLNASMASQEKGTWSAWALVASTAQTAKTSESIETLQAKTAGVVECEGGVIANGVTPTEDGRYLQMDADGNITKFVSVKNGKATTYDPVQGYLYLAGGTYYTYDGEKLKLLGVDAVGSGSGGTADSVAWGSVTGKPNIVTAITNAQRVLTKLSGSGNNIIAQGYNGDLQGVEDSVELKTINGESLIGSGNIEISGSGGTSIDKVSWTNVTDKPDNIMAVAAQDGVITDAEASEDANALYLTKYSYKDGAYSGNRLTAQFKTINGESVVGEGNIEISGGSGGDSGLTLGETATTAFAGSRGVALEEDVKEINDILDAKNLPVAIPQLTVKNTLYKNDGTTEVTDIPSDFVLNSASLNKVENGYKVGVDVSYKWTSNTSAYKDPTAITSDSMTTELTKSGVQSASKTEVISSGKTYAVKLTAPKTGLMVSGTSVVKASGVDTSQASVTYQFLHRVYYGAAADGTDITTLAGTALQSGKSLTVQGVTTDETQKYIFAYPSSLGDLTSILQDGVTPVLTAFTKSTVSVTNGAGLAITYNVYTSNNVGAFTNVKLQFS